jgi:hypothetical protein
MSSFDRPRTGCLLVKLINVTANQEADYVVRAMNNKLNNKFGQHAESTELIPKMILLFSLKIKTLAFPLTSIISVIFVTILMEALIRYKNGVEKKTNNKTFFNCKLNHHFLFYVLIANSNQKNKNLIN